MKKVVWARIRWLTREEGGRIEPPQIEKYSTVVRFEHNMEDSSGWSLVVDLREAEQSEDGLEVIVPVWLLAHDAPNAPNYLLQPDTRFELIEGRRVVAKGQILHAE